MVRDEIVLSIEQVVRPRWLSTFSETEGREHLQNAIVRVELAIGNMERSGGLGLRCLKLHDFVAG